MQNESIFSHHSICMMWILWGSYMGCSSVLQCIIANGQFRRQELQTSKILRVTSHNHWSLYINRSFSFLVSLSCLSSLISLSTFNHLFNIWATVINNLTCWGMPLVNQLLYMKSRLWPEHMLPSKFLIYFSPKLFLGKKNSYFIWVNQLVHITKLDLYVTIIIKDRLLITI